MGALWSGQEDVDFPVQGSGFSISTTGGHFRSGYARCAIINVVGRSFGEPLASPVTDCWVTARVHNTPDNGRFFGIGKNGTLGGIIVGTVGGGGSQFKLGLFLSDAAGAYTEKARETGVSFDGNIQKLDMRVESFGASTRVRIYANGAASPVIDYTGNLLWTGATDLDVFVIGTAGSTASRVSECIIADTDTRAMSLATLFPNANGDANTLTSGAFGDIDEAVINDADLVSSDTTGQVLQVNMSALPAGDFSVVDVTEVLRGIRGATGITKWKHGIKSGGTINVGQTDTMTTSWVNYRRKFGNTNPITGNPWTLAEINAIQQAFESLT